jgi:Spy/CpxP family protein refolding chaperone
VKTYLGLSDSQLTGFQAIRQTARTASEPIIEQLRTKTQALRAAMNTTPVNATTIDSLRAEIAALQAQLDKIQTGARAQMTATLSADQKTKLATLTAAAALREEVQGAAGIGLLEGGRGGPGGPGGREGKGGPGFGKGKGGRGF